MVPPRPPRRPSRLAVGALAVTVGVAACGSSGRSSTATTAPAAPGAPVATAAPTTAAPAPAAPTTTTTPAAADTTWLSYHADASRTAAVAAGVPLDPARKLWTAALGGVVHGQVVVADGRVVAATEDNRVVALDPRTGRVLWSTSLGPPLVDVAAVAGCGDIDPLGITSTPVVDTATGVVYVVGEVATGGSAVHHQLEGLRLSDGHVVLSEDADPPLPAGETAATLLQRAGLALGNGRVYVAYGGNDGDCGNYHGWVVGLDTSGPPHEVSFEVASDGQGGAVWEAGGAPALDAAGDVYVSTGNANPWPGTGPDPKLYTESVVKLSPDLRPLASYKDEVAGGDEDLATGNPVLLPGGGVFAVGKTDIAYVLRRSDLAEVAAVHGVCGSDPDGGPAYDAATATMFVPCKAGGIQEVDLARDTLGPRLAGANSAPVLVGGDLWALQYPEGNLVDIDAATGATRQSIGVGTAVANFASPSVALGLVLVPTDTGVTAFAGPDGVTG